jgi:ABC-type phosphate transport system permease subunit
MAVPQSAREASLALGASIGRRSQDCIAQALPGLSRA